MAKGHRVIATARAPEDGRLTKQVYRLANNSLIAAIDIDERDPVSLPALEPKGIGVREFHRKLRRTVQAHFLPIAYAWALILNGERGDAMLRIAGLPFCEHAGHWTISSAAEAKNGAS
jgi:hypothetical protein